ncbi:MAG: hypothetical protein IPM39_06080 [Chloroflexi bacterium]|nr:hypothetical protein [Chloroflexota bacterium]
MNPGTKNQLVSELARTVVPQVAPYELQFFQAQKEEYLQNPEKVIRTRMGNVATKDNMVFLAPVVHAILEDAIEYIAQEFGQRPLFEGGVSRLIAISLTARQVAQIRQMALAKAHENKLSMLKSRLVADAVINKLAMPYPLN